MIYGCRCVTLFHITVLNINTLTHKTPSLLGVLHKHGTPSQPILQILSKQCLHPRPTYVVLRLRVNAAKYSCCRAVAALMRACGLYTSSARMTFKNFRSAVPNRA